MKFSIMFDHGISLTPCPGCDLTATLIDDLNYVAQHYFSNPQYLTRNGHPVVSEFAMETAVRITRFETRKSKSMNSFI